MVSRKKTKVNPKNPYLQNKKKNRTWRSIILQFFLSALISLVFLLFVFKIQTELEALLKARDQVHNWQTALYFSSVIMLGSFVYDTGKKILLLDADKFEKFASAFGNASVDGIILFIFICLSGFFTLLNLPEWVSDFAQLLGLIWVIFWVRSATNAMDLAIK